MKLSETKQLIVNSQLDAAGYTWYSFHLLAFTLPSTHKKYLFSYHFIVHFCRVIASKFFNNRQEKKKANTQLEFISMAGKSIFCPSPSLSTEEKCKIFTGIFARRRRTQRKKSFGLSLKESFNSFFNKKSIQNHKKNYSSLNRFHNLINYQR